MSKLFAIAAVALVAISSVSGAVVPRASPPKGWEYDILESYDVYHARYLALYCYTQHSHPFFDECCHPRLKSDKSEHPPQCVPQSPAFTSAMQAEPVPSYTPSPSAGDDEDCEDDDVPQSSFVPSSSPAPKPSSSTPKPSSSTPKPSSSTPKPDSTTPKPENTPQPSPTTTPKPSPTTTYTPSSSKHSSSPQPSPTPESDDSGSGGGEVFDGGFATYYFQNGVAGACGKVNPDTALIAALQTEIYGPLNQQSSHCGEQIKVTNKKNGKSVTVIVADACPTCVNAASLDLSETAFKQIATVEEGMVEITWQFL